VKDVIVPLVGPIVAIFVPTLLLYVLPLSQNQQKAAVDLFAAYHGENMRESRNLAWKHFVSEARALPEAERARRLDDYLRYLTEPEVNRTVPAETDALYQKTSRVLDFFVMVNDCLERDTVDRNMVRSFLAYYYLWWHDEILVPLRERPLQPSRNLKYYPLWRG